MTDDKPKKVGRLHKTNDSTIVEALRPLAVSIDSLHHDAANARRHGERNLDAIRASLAQFGQRKPIVVQRDGMIVRAGNGTLEAARALGWTEIAAVVIDEDGTTAAQFAIADNRTAELAEWDNETLATLLDGWDAQTNASLGFDQDDVDQLLERLAPHVDVQEDEVPEPPADPITKPGDLWILGKHRLLCGDSTKAEDVERLMNGEKAAVVFTDPPYGIDYSDVRGRFKKIANDAEDPTNLVARALALQPAAAVYVCCNWRCLHAMIQAMEASGLDPKATIVWDKGARIQNLDRYGKRHELIVYAGPYGGQATLDDDVWEIRRETRDDHPTAKPVELCGRAIQHASDPEAIVFDPFLGSGSTLVAAEQLSRRCYGIEIDSAYCDVIVKRWEILTGKKAEIYNGS